MLLHCSLACTACMDSMCPSPWLHMHNGVTAHGPGAVWGIPFVF